MKLLTISRSLIAATAAVTMTGICYAASVDSNKADVLWEQAQAAYATKDYSRHREIGLRFWRDFPGDARRYQWLIDTAGNRYANQAEENRARWNKLYVEELKPAFMTWQEAHATPEQRVQFFQADIGRRMLAYSSGEYLVSREADAREFEKLFLQYIKSYPTAGDPRIGGANLARDFSLGLFEHDIFVNKESKRRVIEVLLHSPDVNVRTFAAGHDRVMRLLDREKPLQLRLVSLDGQTLDLDAMRGKAVLIDFWATHCASCIQEMPQVKALYDKYRAQGLEVIGIAVNDERSRPKVESLLKKMAISWPQSLDLGGALFNRFGFTCLGYKFLVDKEGYLVASQVGLHDMESRIQRILGTVTAKTK